MARSGILEGIQGASALLNMYHGIRDRQDRREEAAYDRAHRESRERLADVQWQQNYDRQGEQFDRQMDQREREHADNVAYRNASLAEQRRSHNMSYGLQAARWNYEKQRHEQDRADAERAREQEAAFYRSQILGVDGSKSGVTYGEAAAIPGVIKESLGETGNKLLAAAGFQLPEGTPSNAVVGAMDDKKGGIIPVAISKDANGQGRVDAISGAVPRNEVAEFVANDKTGLMGTAFAAMLGLKAAGDANAVRGLQDKQDNREYNLARIDQAIALVQNPKASAAVRQAAAEELEAYRLAGVDTSLRGRSLVEGVAKEQERSKTVRKAELEALAASTKTRAEARLDKDRVEATDKEVSATRKELIASAKNLFGGKDNAGRAGVAANLVDPGLAYIGDVYGLNAKQMKSAAFRAQFTNVLRTAVNLKTNDFAAAYAANQRYGGAANDNETNILLGSYNEAREILRSRGFDEASANRALAEATDALLSENERTNFGNLPQYIAEKYK